MSKVQHRYYTVLYRYCSELDSSDADSSDFDAAGFGCSRFMALVWMLGGREVISPGRWSIAVGCLCWRIVPPLIVPSDVSCGGQDCGQDRGAEVCEC